MLMQGQTVLVTGTASGIGRERRSPARVGATGSPASHVHAANNEGRRR